MKNKIARYPQLFSIPDETGKIPTLKGRHCRECDYVTFPPQDFGCEQCGAGPDALELKMLKGEGILKRFAPVFSRNASDGKPKFVMGSIQLEDGPIIEAVLDCEDDSGLEFGLPVVGVLVENGQNEDGSQILDYCFSVQGG